MPEILNQKSRIMEVAIELFSTRGFRGTSIRDIAGAAGTSISNIYHYFGNKEGLLLAILERVSEDMVAELRRISELDMEPLERFKMLLATHLRLAGSRDGEAKIFFLDEEHLSPEGNEVNLRYQREILGIYVRELRTLEAAGLVRARSLTVLAFNILGVLNWRLRWYRPNGPMSLEEISQEICAFVLHGMLGPAAGEKVPADS